MAMLMLMIATMMVLSPFFSPLAPLCAAPTNQQFHYVWVYVYVYMYVYLHVLYAYVCVRMNAER